MRVFGAALCALLVLPGVIAAPASAGVIHGTVIVPPHGMAAMPAMMNAYPGRASAMPNMRMAERGLAHDAVVYVERIPAAAESALAARPTPMPRLAQKDQCFSPGVVVVAAG